MKKKFSKHWRESKQPRKQRKYLANAPFHIKKKMMNANLSKELRKKYRKRSFSLRTGDMVKIMRGKFKGKQGKIIKIMPKISGIEIEGIQRKKLDGSKVNVKIRPSNLQITELNLEDRKRTKRIKVKAEKTEEKVKPEEESERPSVVIREEKNAPKKTVSA